MFTDDQIIRARILANHLLGKSLSQEQYKGLLVSSFTDESCLYLRYDLSVFVLHQRIDMTFVFSFGIYPDGELFPREMKQECRGDVLVYDIRQHTNRDGVSLVWLQYSHTV